MLPVFRKIRRRLAHDNQFLKYSRYAIGEILLIVVGIIIALQLQNWNENRKQNERFRIVLEQIYNSIQVDIDNFGNRAEMLQNQALNLDSLLVDSEYLPKENLPYLFYWITTQNSGTFNSETSYHLSKLEYNPENPEQNEIARLIAMYADNNQYYKDLLSSDEEMKDNRLYELLKENSIPFPGGMNQYVIDSFRHVMPDYYSEEELKRLHDLIEEPHFRSELKSTFNTLLRKNLLANNRYEEAVSIRDLIKNYYPDIKVIYRNVGVLGDALDGYIGVKSRPMMQTDIKNNIWETQLELGEGSVKFRCRDSWAQNWGGNSFPEGEAQWFGGNIAVEPGRYRITLDLTNYRYSFERLPDESN